jgi:hypothetical protein
MCTLCDSRNINTINEFVSICSYHVTGIAFNGDSDSNQSVPEYTRTLSLETVHTAFEWNVRGWLFPEFGAELPLDNGTPTIILNKHVYINIDAYSKSNRLIIFFPQNGSNFRIKGFHILNAPPFCDDFISLLKRVFKSKFAAR